MMTDGGPEHRVNFESVKIPLILMFKQLKLDSLIAIRTAPGQSYVNIVERIMSILNLGFQNVALEREESPSDQEIKKCGDLSELRQKPIIKDDWQKSVQPLIEVLTARTKRLSLKNVPFKVHNAASEQSIEEFIESSADIDPALPTKIRAKKLAKADLSACEDFQTYKKNHCFEGQYAFQIRRCEDNNCCPGEPLVDFKWLPFPSPDPDNPGHFKKFKEVSDQQPTEEHLPSNVNNVRKVAELEQGCKSSMLTSQNVREIVKCKSCTKPRCIYSKANLSYSEQRELRKIIRSYDYVCGCLITPDVSFLAGKVFTRLEMHCQSPVEWSYYSASKVNTRQDLCCHCIKKDSKVDKEEKKLFKTVLPICDECKGNGKKVMKKGPIQTAKANKQQARRNEKDL
ncbi:uncharacterized protein [Clytia hemisphaerica]|uniref:uncharacterized protein n=1 Tax=Clytia hemisphaerica TaxID=252671 RepID=UPI0034D4F43D